jgi:hypothetical protein
MTLYGPNGGVVNGQPISPFFGAQNGAATPGSPIIPLPAQVNAPQVTLLESAARGAVPRNAIVASINGVNAGAGDNMSVDEAMGSGNGAQVNLGAPVNSSSGNPATNGAISNQEFVGGIIGAVASSANGPAATNTETLTSAPISGATVAVNVSLVANGFQG